MGQAGEREGKLPSVMCVAGPLQRLLLTTSTRVTHALAQEAVTDSQVCYRVLANLLTKDTLNACLVSEGISLLFTLECFPFSHTHLPHANLG